MNKKFIILLLVLIALISTSVFLKKPNNATVDTDTQVKGDTVDSCDLSEKEAKDNITSLTLPRKWYVKSEYTDIKYISFELNIPDNDIKVKYILNENTFDASYEDNRWVINIPINTLENGDYKLIIQAQVCTETISKSFSFKVSNPVYVVWSIDWEGFDVKDEYLNEMSRISQTYSAPMTHFFNPYIYIYLSSTRAKYLTEWVLNRQEESIGLHLHMYNKLIEASGVEVNNNPSWGSPTGNGHDTPNSNYGYDDYKKIIQWAIAQYEKHGLPIPFMYRAGGWYIDEENLLVLKNLGFDIDSSGRTYYKHGSNQLEGHWNLKETTQPYQMNSNDQNITNNPNMNIWEYPNNGGDSWAYSSDKLISRFKSNYDGGIAQNDTVVTFISHPHWFNKEGENIEGVLKYIYQYSFNNDNGPVIFITLDKVYDYTVKQ